MNSSAAMEDEQKQDSSRRSRCRDVFLFSHPRTASNLVTRLLSAQPGWIQTEYHFQDAFQFARKSYPRDEAHEIACENRQQFRDLFNKGFLRLCQERDAAIAKVSAHSTGRA